MNGRERVHEFIRELERFTSGCKLGGMQKRYWDMAADMQLLLDVANAAHDVVDPDTAVITSESYDRLVNTVRRLDREAMRDVGVW